MTFCASRPSYIGGRYRVQAVFLSVCAVTHQGWKPETLGAPTANCCQVLFPQGSPPRNEKLPTDSRKSSCFPHFLHGNCNRQPAFWMSLFCLPSEGSQHPLFIPLPKTQTQVLFLLLLLKTSKAGLIFGRSHFCIFFLTNLGQKKPSFSGSQRYSIFSFGASCQV